MNSRSIICMTFAMLLLVGCGTDSQSENRGNGAAVKSCFAELKAALRSGQGDKAVQYVSPNTIALYERCRKQALDSTETDFESLSQLEVLLSFQLRWLLKESSLEAMDGAGVFTWGVNSGLVKKETIEALELESVQIEGNKAVATIRVNGKPAEDLVLDFELDDGTWKLDLEEIIKAIEPAFAELRKETGTTKIELAVYLMEKTYDKKIPPQILNGPLK